MATDHETIFTLEATPVKFGPGASQDAGWELKRLGVRRALLVTDPGNCGARDRSLHRRQLPRHRVTRALPSHRGAAAARRHIARDG
jgi:alcohol dehydrogenase class IV